MLAEQAQSQQGVDLESETQASSADACTENVLISNKSSLVEVLINDSCTDSQMNFIITVDSENLLRGWSLRDTSTMFSYRINTE